MAWKARVATSGVAGMCALTLFGLQTPPETATANAAKWFGVVNGSTPQWPNAVDAWLSFALVIVLVLLGLDAARRWIKPKPLAMAGLNIVVSPDLSFWQQVDDMALWQAAYLWMGLDPPKVSGPLPPTVQAKLHRLKRAVERGDLQPLEIGESPGDSLLWRVVNQWATSGAHTVVSREALKTYAEQIRERPSFLFQ